jgi:cobalamin biosynthesis protein CobD/CbiB
LRQNGGRAIPLLRKHMPQPKTKKQSTRQWIGGVAVALTTIVCLFAFWRLSPDVTFIIALVALGGMIFSFWLAGGKD